MVRGPGRLRPTHRVGVRTKDRHRPDRDARQLRELSARRGPDAVGATREYSAECTGPEDLFALRGDEQQQWECFRGAGGGG